MTPSAISGKFFAAFRSYKLAARRFFAILPAVDWDSAQKKLGIWNGWMDAIYFDSALPHSCRRRGPNTCTG